MTDFLWYNVDIGAALSFYLFTCDNLATDFYLKGTEWAQGTFYGVCYNNITYI